MNAWTIFGTMGLDTKGVEQGLKRSEDAAKRTAGTLERDVGRSLDSVARRLNTLADGFNRVGRVMSTAVTLPIAAFGGLALRAAGDFESAMNRVAAVSGATGEQLDALNAKARELGATTQFSASQAAEAMGFMAMAGMNADEILGSLEATLRLAASAQLDMGSAADIVTNILAGYNMSVDQLDHAVDVLTKTFTSANTDLSMLAESMKFAGPVAVAAGVQFEEAAAAIGLMGNAGIQGSMAGTALRQAILNMLNPTASAQAAIERLGLTFTDSNGRLLPLADIIEQLGDKYEDTASLAEIFGARNVGAISALASQGGDALRSFTADLEASGGTAQRIADVQMQGFNGALREMRSAFEAVQIAIANSGLLEWATNAARGFAGLLRSVSEIDPAVLRVGTVIAAVFAAVGPALLAVGGAIRLFSTLLLGVNSVRTAALALAVGPAAPFVIIGAVVAALVTAWQTNMLDIQGRTESMVASLRESFGRVRESFAVVVEALHTAWGSFSASVGEVWEGLKDRAGDALAVIVTTVLNGVVVMLNALDWLIRFGTSLVENWGSVAGAWGSILESMRVISFNTGTLIRLGWDVSILAIKGLFTGLFRFIEEGLTSMLNGVIRRMNDVILGINSVFGAAHATISEIVMDSWAGMDASNARAIALAQSDMRALQEMNADSVVNIRNTVLEVVRLIEEGMARGQTATEATIAAADALGVSFGEVVDLLDGMGDAGGAGGAAAGEAFAEGMRGPVEGSIAFFKAAVASAWSDFENAADDAARASALSLVTTLQAALDELQARWAARPLKVEVQVDIARAGIPSLASEPGGLDFMAPASPIYEATRAAVEAGMVDGFADGMGVIGSPAAYRRLGIPVPDVRAVVADLLGIPVPGVGVSVAGARDLTPGVFVNDVRLALREFREEARAERVAIYGANAAAAVVGNYELAHRQFGAFMNAPMAIPVPDVRADVAPGVDVFSQVFASVTASAEESNARAREYQDQLAANAEALARQTERSLATVDAIQQFGNALLSRIPIIGEAFNAFTLSVDDATGKIMVAFDPIGMLASLFERLLGASEVFNDWIGRVVESLQPFAEMLGTAVVQALGPLVDGLVQLLGAVMPLVQVVLQLLGGALQPLVWLLTNVVAPAFKFVADAIVAIYNALLGWLFGRISADSGRAPTGDSERGATPGGGLSGVRVDRVPSAREASGYRWAFDNEDARLEPGSIDWYNARINALRQFENQTSNAEDRAAARAERTRLEGFRDALVADGGAATPTPRTPTTRTPTSRAPTFTPATPEDVRFERPTLWGDDTRASFGGVSQSLQMGVATPLVEASVNMLAASQMMQAVFGGMMPGDPSSGVGSMNAFTNALDRATPVLERLAGGIRVGVQGGIQQHAVPGMWTRMAALRGF